MSDAIWAEFNIEDADMLRILCVGDNNVDIYLDDMIVFPGGCALNAAAFAAQLGHKVSYISTVGNDILGELQLGSLKSLGVDVSRAHIIEEQTAWCHITLKDGNRHFSAGDSGAKAKLPLTPQDVAVGQSGEYDLLYTSTDACFGPGAFEQFGKSDTPAFCDFSSYWTRESLLSGCKNFTYVGMSCEDMPMNRVKALLRDCCNEGVKLAIGTMGMNGSYVYNGQEFFYQEAYDLHAVDTLGAGDSFLIMFMTSYLDGIKQLMPCMTIGDGLDSNESCVAKCEAALIRKSMCFASLFAAKTCLSHGAFGHEIPFDFSMISRSKAD